MKSLVVRLAPLLLLATPAAAQVQVELTPRIGVYVPLEDLTTGTDIFTALPLTQKAATKFTVGGRLGLWLTRGFGFEGTVDYNKGDVKQIENGAVLNVIGSHLFATSGRAMTKVGLSGGNVAFILSAGGGLVDRGGAFIQGTNPPTTTFGGRTDIAAAGGLGLQFKLSRTVSGRLDADAFTYTAQYLNSALGNTSSRRQWDLFITFGLSGIFRDYGMPNDR